LILPIKCLLYKIKNLENKNKISSQLGPISCAKFQPQFLKIVSYYSSLPTLKDPSTTLLHLGSNHRCAKDMWFVFQNWGKVKEVFIPNKRNKFGKKFGFVKFDKIANPKALEEKLDNIFIGEMKLHVNLPRFNREREMMNEKNYGQTMFVNEKRRESAAMVRNGRSYAQAVTGGSNIQKDFPILGDKTFIVLI
jgi:hypothetical protein